MSYEIIYNRQFIKVDNDKVIQMLEMGSNNCYDAYGNGRRRSRSWGSSRQFTDESMIVNNTRLLELIDKFESETKERSESNATEYKDDSWAYDPKRFGYHVGVAFYGRNTRSTTFSAFRSYYANAIKKAMTIEQLGEYNIKVTITVYRWKDEDITSKGLEIKPDVTFTDTQHMISVINEYESYYKGHGVSIYLNYNSDWAIENMFKNRSIINKREQQNKRATKKPHEVNEYYVLENNNGYFVRNTARGYKYSYWLTSSTKRFMTEKEANSFKTKMRNGDLFNVKKVEAIHTFYK